MSGNNLSPQIFTGAVQPYIDFLQKKFNDKPLCVSDRGALAATIFLAKHTSTETEIEELIGLGEKVPFSGKTFSIFHDGKKEFKTEDRLIENSTFEWQQYKQQRMLDRTVRKDQKEILKENASLEMMPTAGASIPKL